MAREEFEKLDSGLDHIFAVLRVDRLDRRIKTTDVVPNDSDFLKTRSFELEGLSRKRVSQWGKMSIPDEEAAEEPGEEEEDEEGYEI